ncbi:hypothetical protein AL350_gp34 [Equine adenovirus 2]|uniref:Uncharacterized protein n=1 Tax=Equine adenovirus B serotype 2 TaxID=67603 RepID=A0A0K1DBX3_ADEE2|nr:hypothetical protein AL350_gp34 [Equine adenovirus 2]AKT26047.1 hypothetical protein [Equine adenovirus 2]
MVVIDLPGMKVSSTDHRFPPFLHNNSVHLRSCEDVTFYPGVRVPFKLSGKIVVSKGKFAVISDSDFMPKCMKGVGFVVSLYNEHADVTMDFRLAHDVPSPIMVPAGTPLARLRVYNCTFPGCTHDNEDCM